mmetsp:Transcript_21264/g.39152  ORF Transcript_21264/g.39152 Transcript_21264/m.39152 type:complete len:97 (+) Transcript_21264:157-447(+)
MKVLTPNHCNRRLLSSLASLEYKQDKVCKAAPISRSSVVPSLIGIRLKRRAPTVSSTGGLSLFKAFQAISEKTMKQKGSPEGENQYKVLSVLQLNK